MRGRKTIRTILEKSWIVFSSSISIVFLTLLALGHLGILDIALYVSDQPERSWCIVDAQTGEVVRCEADRALWLHNKEAPKGATRGLMPQPVE